MFEKELGYNNKLRFSLNHKVRPKLSNKSVK
jgi:hypothetical protein